MDERPDSPVLRHAQAVRIPAPELAALARLQEGVVSTAHLTRLGADPAWIHRQVAAGHWQRMHRGVLYVHSGPIPWRARALGAVVYAADDAALSHRAAGHLLGLLAREPDVIEVSIPGHRRIRPTPGVRVHVRGTMPRSRGFLPVVVAEETTVDLVAQARSTDEAVAVVCAAVSLGTPVAAIAAAARRRTRVRHRELLADLLADVTEGVESPLERRYHHDVERRHGLPRARLQRTEVAGGGRIRADCVYEGFGVRVELDGRLGHPGGRTDADTWRDNAVLLEHGDRTLRYRWRHVAVTPCETAAQVTAALRVGGWTGAVRPCSPGGRAGRA